MSQPLVRVEGARELRRTMKAAALDLDDLKAANARAAAMVAQWASVTAPRRTGALGASVRAARQAGRARIVAGNAAVRYSGPIHWGWPARHLTAQPWVSQAAVDTQPAWLPVYSHDIQRILNTVRGA
jgi:hypothetical protein